MTDQEATETVMAEKPERHGVGWREDEDEKLVQRVREGVATADIAHEFDRTVSSIRNRAAKMLPAETHDEDGDRMTVLRELLATDPAYDWRAHLNARKSRRQRGKQSPKIDDEDLITIAEVLCGSTDYHRVVAAETMVAEVDVRGLWEKVVARRAHHLRHEADAAERGDLRELAHRELDEFRRTHLDQRGAQSLAS